MKLTCTMIVRNEEQTLGACLASVRPHVDELIIVDTGSTDSSPVIAKNYATKWVQWTGCNNPETGLIEDFAAARNYADSLSTGDWGFWIDGDDILVGGENLRRLCEQAPPGDVQILARYEYAHDDKGNCTTMQIRERLQRGKRSWRSPVHEVCTLETPGQHYLTEEFRIIHKSGPAKQREPGRNLRILEAYIRKAGEGDIRAMYYLASEYATAAAMCQAMVSQPVSAQLTDDSRRALEGLSRQYLGDSNRYLRRYIQLSGWADERCLAEIQLAKNYLAIADYDMAIEWAQKALLTKAWFEPYYVISKALYETAECVRRAGKPQEVDYNYRRAAHFAQAGLTLTNEATVLFIDTTLKHRVHEHLSACLGFIGDFKGALWSAERGLAAYPDSQLLKDNARAARQNLLRQEICERAGQLEAPDVVKELIQQAAMGQVDVPSAPAKPAEVVTPAPRSDLPPCKVKPRIQAPGCLDIILWTGPAYENWNPEHLEREGMGGSETMAWEMSRRLAKLGHRVRHYGQCTPEQEGNFEGVEWVSHERMGSPKCDLFLVSRQASAVDLPVQAKARVLWVHDVICHDITRERILKFDRILCLSNWHKATFLAHYKSQGMPIDPDKVVVTRNGVDLSRFEGTEERKPHRAIWSSSPDRGLQLLLQEWPRIRAKLPNAELHVFYGRLNWVAAAKQRNDPEELAALEELERMLNSTPGVFDHGRVNAKQLAREFMKSGCWIYSTWFFETSCLTAMEAQIAGCRIAYSPLAALNETVRGGRKLEGDYGSQQFRDSTVQHAIEMMSMGEWPPRKTEGAREAFNIETLATDWSTMLRDIVKDVNERVVPKYYWEAAE